MTTAKKTKKVKKKLFPTIFEPVEGSTKMEMLRSLYQRWYGCQRCPLHEFRKKPTGESDEEIVFGSGNPDSGILIIGEAPGEDEYRMREPFVGVSGHLLNELLASCSDDPNIQILWKQYVAAPKSEPNRKAFQSEVAIWRDKNFFFTNMVCCRPPENRMPVANEVETCWPRLWTTIYTVDPMLIIACGRTAFDFLTGTKMEITKYRGELFDIEYQGRVAGVSYPIFPILHPSYLLRKADWEIPGGEYDSTRKDLIRALKSVDFLRQHHYGALPTEERK